MAFKRKGYEAKKNDILSLHSFYCSLCWIYALIWFPIQVSAESANQFGALVADPVTNELLHYTEKPETFV